MKHIIHFAVLFIVFLTMETATLYILYEYIYRYAAGDKSSGNAGGHNGSFVHLLKRVVKYYWWIFHHREKAFHEKNTYPYSRQMRKFLTQQSSFRAELARNIILLASGMAVLGIVVIVMVIPPSGNLSLGSAFYSAVIFVIGITVMLDFTKRYRGYLFEFLQKSELFLTEFSKILKFEVTQKEEEKVPKEDAVIPKRFKIFSLLMVLVILLTAISVVVLQWSVFAKLYDAESGLISLTQLQMVMGETLLTTVVSCLVFLLVCCIIWKEFRQTVILRIKDFLRKITSRWAHEAKQAAKNTERILICPDLSPWAQSITEMCRELHLETMSFQTDERIGMNARAVIGEDSTPTVIVGTELLDCLHRQLGTLDIPAVRFILGHELAHIYFRDQKDPLCKRAAWLLVVSFPFAIGFAVISSRLDSKFLAALTGLAVVIWCGFVLSKLSDDRFCKQIMELRADRIGLQVSRTDPDTFRMLVPFLKVMEEEGNSLYRYYKKYIDVAVHPSLQTRLKELERRKRWGIWEYARYIRIIQFNIITGQGWRL